VVFLDIGLPKLNGYEVARRIRETPEGKTMLLVSITGSGQEDDKQQALKAGFNRQATKPIDLDVVEQLLQTLHAPTLPNGLPSHLSSEGESRRGP
jgi:CheY-like chemotaxis protein